MLVLTIGVGDGLTEFAANTDPEASKRRTTRIVQAVPLTVAGVDALGRPFQERTSTLIINCHGCRYQSKHYVLKNMWVTLEIPHPETGREPRSVRARVSWIQRPRTVRELFQVGVELEVPGNVWGIAFPPEDWFPFPEVPISEIPPPAAELPAEAETAKEEWVLPAAPPPEDNVRVLPGPGTADASLNLGRQVARLVAEAKQQVQSAAREATATAVAEETRPLLATLQDQMKEAAEKAVEAAAAAYTKQAVRDALAKIEEAKQAGEEALREKSAELQRRAVETAPQPAKPPAEIDRAHLSSFEKQVKTLLDQASEKLNRLRGETTATIAGAEAGVARFRQQLDEAGEAASRRWQEMVGARAKEAKAQLEELAKAAQHLNGELSAAAAAAQTTWRARLDADLAAAGTRWNERLEASLESASRKAADRLARHSQTASSKLEQDLTLRVAALRESFERATAEAESTLGTQRAALEAQTARAKSALVEIQQAADRMEEFSSRLDIMSQATAGKLQERFEEILAKESLELNRRAESAIAGMAERLQPVLEEAGQQSLARLAAQLEQRLAPRMKGASEVLAKLTAGAAQAEEVLHTLQQRLAASTEHVTQESIARLAESVSRFEHDFQEMGRAATQKWLAELEAKATETTHSTFEALYKSSEWYEKKVQTQMQAALEKGLDQASNQLREKAGEISGLFASELDHYSRSFVEHTQGQMDEAVKDAVQRARGLFAQAAETSASTLADEAHRVAQRQLEQFNTSLSGALDQTAGRLEAHLAQTRSRIDADARQFFADFHKGMTQEIQKGVAAARQELEVQSASVKNAWGAEREAQERQLQDALARLGGESIETYKKRLENVSNSWLVTTVTRLSQQSQDVIGTLATSAEQRLREIAAQVFAGVGETLRQRLLDVSTGLPGSAAPTEKK